MRTTSFLLALAAAFGLLGIARGQQYGPPYDCIYYYTCANSQPCTAQNGVCLGNNYNHYFVQGGELGMCLSDIGTGCTYFNGNATCYYTTYFFDMPGGADCGEFDVVCGIPTNNATGCDYGFAPP